MAKILIIEDSRLIVTMMKKYLAEDKHECTIATSGEEAIKLLETIKMPELILLDIVMEGIDGFEMLKILKSNPKTESIPVLFVTSKDKGTDIAQGLSLGAEDYIIKPFTANEIRNKVMSNLN